MIVPAEEQKDCAPMPSLSVHHSGANNSQPSSDTDNAKEQSQPTAMATAVAASVTPTDESSLASHPPPTANENGSHPSQAAASSTPSNQN